jgi:Mg2+ and Co2+ transporter CorA
MNTTVPGSLWHPLEFWFFVVLALMFAITCCMVIIFRRMRWL